MDLSRINSYKKVFCN